MMEHLAAMLVSAIAFLGAILLYGAFSPRRLGGWKFWICFAAYCVLMEGAGPLANGLYSVYGIIGSGVGRQMLYNTTIYCLLYVVLYKERPMVYLSITVVFYSWTCCIENLVVGAMLIRQVVKKTYKAKVGGSEQWHIGISAEIFTSCAKSAAGRRVIWRAGWIKKLRRSAAMRQTAKRRRSIRSSPCRSCSACPSTS